MGGESPRAVGRPLLGKEARKRYQVVLEPKVAEKLRRYGSGNLSAGIAKAAKRTQFPYDPDLASYKKR